MLGTSMDKKWLMLHYFQLASHAQYRLGIRPEDLHLVNDNEISNYPIQLSQFTVDLVSGSYKLLPVITMSIKS